MKIIATIIGVTAAVLFILSYQIKTRRGIIFCSAASRVFYVLQYILLGAFAGAALDIAAFVVSVLAQKKNCGPLKAHPRLLAIGSSIFLIVVGMAFYENIFSIIAIAGVLFETGAFWLNREKHIRIVSFFGAPCWLAYNLASAAYGSAIGNVLVMLSILTAIVRYDVLGREEKRAK